VKAITGFTFFLLFLAGLAFVMLQGRLTSEFGSPGGGAGLTGVTWRPVSFGNETIPEDADMYIRFEVDGSFKGHGGCNGFFGSLKQSDSGLEVGPMAATSMACDQVVMNREKAFLDAVQNTRDFRTGNGRMSLLDEGGREAVKFVAVSDGEAS
jgi:heat shock protein HslJ